MMNSKHDKLIDLLKYHDWFFDYSDDPRTYQWGHDNQINIERELDNLGRTKEAMLIYEDAIPDNLKQNTISGPYTEETQPKSNFIDSGSQHLPMSKPEDRF
tara:strand:+ start:420 stop:722 length:303 start_codon:yes stop_codon:yes gene_type:complete